MTERMVLVGFLAREPEADQRDHRRAGIRKGVEGIGHDGDRAGEQAGEELGGKEQDIDGDAHTAAQQAVLLADGRVAGVGVILDKKTNKKIGHKIFSWQVF